MVYIVTGIVCVDMCMLNFLLVLYNLIYHSQIYILIVQYVQCIELYLSAFCIFCTHTYTIYIPVLIIVHTVCVLECIVHTF